MRAAKGPEAVPCDVIVLEAFPETRTGKYMRRMLRAVCMRPPTRHCEDRAHAVGVRGQLMAGTACGVGAAAAQ